MNCINENYMSRIEGFSVLSAEEEKSLAVKMVNGDSRAREKLIMSNLKFVIKVAHQYKHMGLDFEDLVQEGNCGLIAAVDRFNPEFKTRFITFAVWSIKDSIQKAIRETSTGIRFPGSRYQDMKNVKFEHLDAVMDEDSGCTLYELIEDTTRLNPEDEYINNYINDELHGSMESLDDRERFIIERRYGFDNNEVMSLAELGRELGMSKEGIRFVEKKALREMYELLAG